MLSLKQWMVAATDVSPTALHMLCGIILYLLLAVALDRRLSSGRALTLTLVVVVGAETWEWAAMLSDALTPDPADSIADVGNAAVWPLLLWIGGRRMAAARG